jgi:hypothetical protein
MKTFLRRADVWAAKRLFFPVIVRFCQATGLDQFGFAGYAAVISTLFWVPLMAAGGAWANMLMQIVGGLVVVTMVVMVGILGKLPSQPRPFWRGFGWVMVIEHGIMVMMIGNGKGDGWLTLSWLCMLFAEYAWMIDRIPPLEKEQEEPQVRAAEAF